MSLELHSLEIPIPGQTHSIQVSGVVRSGECVLIQGASGLGKTTFLKTLAGVRRAASGKMILNKKDLTYVKPQNRNIGMVFQGGALWEHMTVGENILWGLRTFRKEKEKSLKNLVVEELKGLGMVDSFGKMPAQLSGGEKARVALLRTLVLDFDLYLLDEPFAGLDEKTRFQCIDWIQKRFNQTNAPALMVSHEVNILATRQVIWKSSETCFSI